MKTTRWGNDGRPHCIHLWVPCSAIVVNNRPDLFRGIKPVEEIAYKICIRPECRKVLT